MSIWVADHYKVRDLPDMAAVRHAIPATGPDEMNWLFVGTSGVHGTYLTLDEAEAQLREPRRKTAAVTVLIVRPRTCVLLCGEVRATSEDVAWLRNAVRGTIAAVARSQDGSR